MVSSCYLVTQDTHSLIFENLKNIITLLAYIVFVIIYTLLKCLFTSLYKYKINYILINFCQSILLMTFLFLNIIIYFYI